MSTRAEIEITPESAQAEERPGEGDGSFGLVHLAACCDAAGAAVLAVILIEWVG